MTTDAAAQEFEQAHQMAVAYLGYSDRTVSQVRTRLAQKGCSEALIDTVIAGLKRARLLDDAAYARRWIEYGLERRPAGSAKFAADLRRRGIDGGIIESTLAEFADEVGSKEAALGLLQSRMSRYLGLERPVAERRMRDLLARRGFDGETTRTAVEEALQSMVSVSE